VISSRHRIRRARRRGDAWRASFNAQERPTAPAQSAYVAASQLYIQPNGERRMLRHARPVRGRSQSVLYDGEGPRPRCRATQSLDREHERARRVSAGPCATALARGSGHPSHQAAIQNALDALQAGDSAASAGHSSRRRQLSRPRRQRSRVPAQRLRSDARPVGALGRLKAGTATGTAPPVARRPARE